LILTLQIWASTWLTKMYEEPDYHHLKRYEA